MSIGELVAFKTANQKYKLRIAGVAQPTAAVNAGDRSEFVFCAPKSLLQRKAYLSVLADNDVTRMPLGYLYHDSVVGGTNNLYYAPNRPENMSLLGTFDGVLTNGIPRNWHSAIGIAGEILWAYSGTRAMAVKPRVHMPSDYATAPEISVTGGIYPLGWLQNSGVDFAVDAGGNEYCIFAEYIGTREGDLYVWKVTKPYNTASNWTRVLTKTQGATYLTPDNDIWHFHTANWDPYGHQWFVTSGDLDEHCKWWTSDDHGATWTQVVNNPASTWGSQTARLLNFVFTKDYVYWANDNRANHGLYRLPRDGNGKIDTTQVPTKLCDLNPNQATYATISLHSPNGILLLDRVEGPPASTTDKLDVQFWSFDDNKLYTLATLQRKQTLASGTVFGFRCKAYTLYQGLGSTKIIVGFDEDYNALELPYNSSGRRTTLSLEVY